MFRVHESQTASGSQRVWMLSRNCALTPRQLGAFYLSLVVASVAIATVFLLRGAWMILPFTLVEMMAVGLALFCYARHALDGDRVSLDRTALEIESIDGDRRSVTRVDPRAARVEMSPKPRGALAVVARGERIVVGRCVCEPERRRFARELRQALSTAG